MMYCPARRPIAAPHPVRRAIDGARVETAVLLEAAAIALGASDLTPECMGLARAADTALRACRHDPSAAAGLARLFHQALLTACPNTHMLELIRETSDPTPFGTMVAVGADELGRVADDHETILDMIAAGAPSSELERSLRQHASRSALCSMGLLADHSHSS